MIKKSRKAVGCVIAFAGTVLVVLVFIILTDLGIFAGGYRFYMWRAATATDSREVDANLRRVLGSSQYGVNLAENYVRTVEARATRIRLWGRLIALAPNESWRTYYGYDLEAEYGRGPYAKPSGGLSPPNSAAAADSNAHVKLSES